METKPANMRKIFFAAIAIIGCTAAHAQFDFAKKMLKGKDPLELKKAPISTNLSDAKWAVDSLDNFTPGESKKSLLVLQRTTGGAFVLEQGYYELKDQSYCLHAGTHGPGGGDGYIYAPPVGSMDDIVMAVVRNSVQHPEIQQHDVQILLWGIVARAKFDDMQDNIKLVATKLLTPKQLVKMNGGAMGLVPQKIKSDAVSSLPPVARQAYEAEQQLRNLLTMPGTTYDQLERVAVLSGMAPMGEGSKQIPTGRWSLHPDGYYIRYIPSGYTTTIVQIWVPQGSPAVGKEYDPATHIAVPGNTARQRLIQSGRPQNH
jgi:hypothetical protein